MSMAETDTGDALVGAEMREREMRVMGKRYDFTRYITPNLGNLSRKTFSLPTTFTEQATGVSCNARDFLVTFMERLVPILLVDEENNGTGHVTFEQSEELMRSGLNFVSSLFGLFQDALTWHNV